VSDWREIEGVARWALERAHVGVGEVVDLMEVAEANRVRVIPTPGRSYSAGDVVWLRSRAVGTAARWQLAHELGHVFAARGGLDRSCERTASALGAALLLPDRTLKRELDAHAWDLEPIIDRHGVTWMIAVRRTVEVVSAYGTVVDARGRVRWRGRSPWLLGHDEVVNERSGVWPVKQRL
jgi:hypothetical protein